MPTDSDNSWKTTTDDTQKPQYLPYDPALIPTEEEITQGLERIKGHNQGMEVTREEARMILIEKRVLAVRQKEDPNVIGVCIGDPTTIRYATPEEREQLRKESARMVEALFEAERERNQHSR